MGNMAFRFILFVTIVFGLPAVANDRVALARERKALALAKLFAQADVFYPAHEVFLRAFKAEGQLELWARNKTSPFKRVKSYAICASSGTLGPKRKFGDLQVPEGFYRIARFNPESAFHLSLGVNYPNESDRLVGVQGKLGGDIFIHGNCVTVGCMPIGDDAIEEVYLAALDARSRGQKGIEVHIFPRRMDAVGMALLEKDARGDSELLEFWKSLEPGYRAFEESARLPKVSVDGKGRYVVAKSPGAAPL